MKRNPLPDYRKRANDNYRNKHDVITLVVDKGTKERMKHFGKGNADIKRIIAKWLDKLEREEKEKGGGVT